MRTITLPEVRRAAKALPADKVNPENVLAYRNHQPCCLVGHVLRRCGAPLPPPDEPYQSLDTYPLWAQAKGIALTDAAASFLEAAQTEADDGEPWGECIKAGNQAVA